MGEAQASQMAAVQVKSRPPQAVPSIGSKYSENPSSAISAAVLAAEPLGLGLATHA